MTSDGFSGIGGFIVFVAVAFGVAGAIVGVGLRGCRHDPKKAESENYLIHPETTPEVKWVKMTRPTRDALMGIYAEHMDECAKFMESNDRVTTGEAAILWLMNKAGKE